MLAKIIDIDEELIYLEIENQIRFASPYTADCLTLAEMKHQEVEVEFLIGAGPRCVQVRIKKTATKSSGME